ncbi:hypothetical protein [Sphingomonas bacterium]|uniref:hypothetical protein n=1 Tax=Sphingomonas bacterium TaxID=1895847 RepID=UPI0015772780|nr:hypothetical protein [Sphingomonas bacterium]
MNSEATIAAMNAVAGLKALETKGIAFLEEHALFKTKLHAFKRAGGLPLLYGLETLNSASEAEAAVVDSLMQLAQCHRHLEQAKKDLDLRIVGIGDESWSMCAPQRETADTLRVVGGTKAA